LDTIQVEETEAFQTWRSKLRDRKALQRIATVILRLRRGLGNVKRLSADVSEVKIDCGPGYRLYFTRRGEALIILLCGGDKSTQQRDIEKAEELVAGME
jgi:putative addiction module killer protein